MKLGRADVCIVGAGAAGCVLAARLSDDPARRVCLVEAGPDHGHLDEGRWPAELLDASDCATTHDWGYGVDSSLPRRRRQLRAQRLPRRVGHAGRLREWAAATGDPGWGWEAMAPRLRRAEAAIETRAFTDAEVGGWTRLALRGWARSATSSCTRSTPRAPCAGYGLVPVNRRGRTRVSAALAFLDPARARPNLTIVADALADRVLVDAGRATGIAVRHGGLEATIAAPVVVLASGAYGSPAILLRSGIGPPDELRALDIPVLADVPGVGRGLHDHPCVSVAFELLTGLRRRAGRRRRVRCPDARPVQAQGRQLALRARHVRPAPAAQRGLAARRRRRARPGGHEVSLLPVLLKPRARGTVRLRSADPGVVPEIDRDLFADPEGHDLAVLAEGVELARTLAASPPVAPALAGELDPGRPPTGRGWRPGSAGRPSRSTIRPRRAGWAGPTTPRRWPTPTAGCAAWRAARGRRVGVPVVPRANTHLSVLAFAGAMAERIARRPARGPVRRAAARRPHPACLLRRGPG